MVFGNYIVIMRVVSLRMKLKYGEGGVKRSIEK